MKKIIQKTLLTAGIALLLASCGEKAPGSTTSSSLDSLPDTLKIKRLSKTYVITGIGVSGSNRVAIINDQVVTPGIEIDSGVVIKEIHPTYATLNVGGKEHLLRPEDIQRKLDKKEQ
jgi:hypothetical protein